MFKIANNLKMLGRRYEFITIDEELNLYRIVTGSTIITIDLHDPKHKEYIISNPRLGTMTYKSEKGIVNRLWDLYR